MGKNPAWYGESTIIFKDLSSISYLDSMNRRLTLVAILLATGCVCVCCMFACLPGNQSKTERVLHHVWGATCFFFGGGSKKTGDSGGASPFIETTSSKTKMKQWHLLFCYHLLERETRRRLRGMMTVKLHGLSCDECGKSDHHGLNQPTFDFWVVLFLQAVKLREVLQE